MLTTICAIGGGMCMVAVIGLVMVVIGWLVYRVVSRSRDQGVVFRDGLTKEEMDIVLGEISKTVQSQRVKDTLAKVQQAVTDALAKAK